MTAFTWIPDQGVSRKSKAKVNKAQFGDGYQQRSGDTINSVGQVWELSFTMRTYVEIAAIVAFLEPKKGVTSFSWSAPDGSNNLYTCDTWSESFNHSLDASLSATFDRVYET